MASDETVGPYREHSMLPLSDGTGVNLTSYQAIIANAAYHAGRASMVYGPSPVEAIVRLKADNERLREALKHCYRTHHEGNCLNCDEAAALLGEGRKG